MLPTFARCGIVYLRGIAIIVKPLLGYYCVCRLLCSDVLRYALKIMHS